MPTDDELLGLLGQALAPRDRAPAPDRVAALRVAVAQRPIEVPHTAPGAHVPRLQWLTGVAAAAAVAVAFLAGANLVDSDDTDPTAGTVEFEAALRSPAGDSTAEVVGIKTGIGRIVRLNSDDLPILPKGEYYEVWFVGPGDTPAKPNRISAGTFHPDDQGRSEVELTAAVDPAKYPELAVTAEPGDGNPAPNGPEVLRTRLQVKP